MTKATEFLALTNDQIISKVGKLCRDDMKKSGVLASVTLAQFILESNWGRDPELAQKANNCFGMKTVLSGNTWAGSTWDVKSVQTKLTWEQNPDGSIVHVMADFRKYKSVEDSIADHSAYLVGAKKNGKKLRYKGIAGMTDYRKVAQLIKDGGYATDLEYVNKLCRIIETYNLTQFDYVFKVQIGSYSIEKGAKDLLAEIKGEGYSDAFIVEVPVTVKK